jgi:A/G-specific adenine glycosylase
VRHTALFKKMPESNPASPHQYRDFTKRLIGWYKHNARALPWRNTCDPYKIWISEVMLAQTTVTAVIPYYKKWIKAFPTVKKAAGSPLRRILKIWQGLGYYQRARNIQKAARAILDEHAGSFPRNPEDLRKLAGFGPYITAAVSSIAFDLRQPVIDANVRRVVMRLLALKGHADIRQDRAIFSFLEKVLPLRQVGTFNQALMELGALICRPQTPLCLKCPSRIFCSAYKKGLQEVIPAPRKRTVQKIEAVAAIIKRGNRYFIQKRPPHGLLADLWEFPGGKIERGESAREALSRELKEELGVSLVSAKHLMSIKHFYTKFQVRLHAWYCQVVPYPSQDKAHKWLRLAALKKYPMPSGSAKIVERLASPSY